MGVDGGEQVLAVAAELVHVGGEDPARRDGLSDGLVVAIVPADDHLVGHAGEGGDIPSEFIEEEGQILARLEHDLLGHLVVAREGVDLGAVGAGAVHLAAYEEVPLKVVVGLEGGEHGIGQHVRLGKVGLVHKVHEVLGRVVLAAHGGPKGADDVGGGVPRVGIGPAQLGVSEVLVVGKDVGERGRDGGRQDGVDRDVEGRAGGHVDLDILLAYAGRGGLDPKDDELGVVVVAPGLLALFGRGVPAGLGLGLLGRADLGVPVKGAWREDFRDVIAGPEAADPPRDEAKDDNGPEGVLEERGVVQVEVALELGAALLPVDAAKDALGEAGGFDDLEALLEGGLGGAELEEEGLAFQDVLGPVVLPDA